MSLPIWLNIQTTRRGLSYLRETLEMALGEADRTLRDLEEEGPSATDSPEQQIEDFVQQVELVEDQKNRIYYLTEIDRQLRRQ